MSARKILVVEDDPDIAQLLSLSLNKAGFETLVCDEGYDALETVRRQMPDLIVLDLMIPGIDGFDVCKELKREQKTSRIPILILTARAEEIDRIVGLELGADDYVVKPFSPRELVLRVRAILRRATPEFPPVSVFRKSGLEIDFEAHRVNLEGREVILTATEFKLLSELVRKQGKVLTREQLLDKVWGYHFDGYARTVDTHIRRLRQKLMGRAEWIETVRGIGYRFQDQE
ncbi:MAG: response regulator transcription factor [Desulfobacteraceae bacterium]|nr:response regulator transcription factor [Desulfobacteraceae bacterium]